MTAEKRGGRRGLLRQRGGAIPELDALTLQGNSHDPTVLLNETHSSLAIGIFGGPDWILRLSEARAVTPAYEITLCTNSFPFRTPKSLP